MDNKVNVNSHELLSRIPLNVSNGELLTMVYFDLLTEKQLKSSGISDWNKELILLAYYEKNNKKSGMKYIKDLKNKYVKDNEKVRLLNKILGNMAIKKPKACDFCLYEQYLNCSIDFDYLNKPKTPEISATQPVEIKEEIKTKPAETTNKYVIFEGENGNSRTKNTIIQNDKIKNNKNKFKEKKRKVIKEDLIKDLLEDDIIKIQKYLYCEIQNKSLLAENKDVIDYVRLMTTIMDRLEVLINKPVNDEKSLRILNDLLEEFKLNNNRIVLTQEKVKKYQIYC